MNQRDQTLLIWILSVAGMILLLLYSPWGSPDLYQKKIYFTENQGVNFTTATVRNLPKSFKAGSNDNYTELGIQEYYSERNRMAKGQRINYSGNTPNHVGAYAAGMHSGSGNSYRAYSYNQSQVIKSGSSEAGGDAGINGSFSSAKMPSRNMNPVNSFAGVGTSTLSVDLTLPGDSASNPANSTLQKAGISSPSSDPLATTAIPIPDGWLFLLLLAAAYGFLKMNYVRKIFGLLKQPE